MRVKEGRWHLQLRRAVSLDVDAVQFCRLMPCRTSTERLDRVLSIAKDLNHCASMRW